ncbi:MAG TPA: lysophospholipid acyltransferase family protein [Aridibacter sp.]|nr:lysophospholipid acyltransferase family protein [Aridibacter sp.]
MPKKRSSFRLKMEAAAVRMVFAALRLFPLRMSMAIGRGIGRAVSRMVPRLRKTAERNLEIAMPELTEDRRREIIAGTYGSLGRQLGFVAHFPMFKPEDIRDLVEVVGKNENFDPAFEEGRGVLFFTGHFGSWEVFSLLPAAFGYEMNILVRRIDNPLVEGLIDSLRTRFGTVTLGKRQSGRRLYRILEKGGLLGILADLNAQHRDGVFVDFFGVPASTTKSMAKIALKTRTVVLPAFAVWEKDKRRYVVYLEPPIDYEVTDDREKDIQELTRKITEAVERFVRKYPEQWLWIHKRWNTRPKGEKELY